MIYTSIAEANDKIAALEKKPKALRKENKELHEINETISQRLTELKAKKHAKAKKPEKRAKAKKPEKRATYWDGRALCYQDTDGVVSAPSQDGCP